MNPETRVLLRITKEPFHYFAEEDVHVLLTATPKKYIDFLDSLLGDIATGQATLQLPAKMLLEDSLCQGDFRVMPCIIERQGKISKTVKVVGTNTVQKDIPDQITVGKALALHPRENYISHIFEACLLSSARTGACAAIATMRFTDTPKRLGIIGAGRVGYYSALYISATADVDFISIYDRDQGRAAAMARLLNDNLANVSVVASKDPFPARTDVLVLATTSLEPFCDPEKTDASLVISLGADCDSQHELGSEWPTKASVFVDTLDSVRYGDLRMWIQNKMIDRPSIVELLSAYRNPSLVTSSTKKVFISTGSALFDNMTIAYILSTL